MTAYGYDDIEDDSMAANPEPARADLGYEAANAPRLRRRPTGGATRWTFVEVDAPREAASAAGPHRCERCGESAPVLHPIGDDPRRRYCGACQGAANRERVGWAQAAEPGERGGRAR